MMGVVHEAGEAYHIYHMFLLLVFFEEIILSDH